MSPYIINFAVYERDGCYFTRLLNLNDAVFNVDSIDEHVDDVTLKLADLVINGDTVSTCCRALIQIEFEIGTLWGRFL